MWHVRPRTIPPVTEPRAGSSIRHGIADIQRTTTRMTVEQGQKYYSNTHSARARVNTQLRRNTSAAIVVGMVMVLAQHRTSHHR